MSGDRLVVLVHGAWHGGWCWAPLQAELDRRGVASFAPDLPGHGTSPEPLGDLTAHVDHVRALLGRLHRDVVLVGHSYAGAVVSGASDALTPASTVVYVTAYALTEGESVNDVIRADPPSTTHLRDAFVRGPDGTATLDPGLAGPLFYARCPPAAASAAVARLGPEAMANFTQPAPADPFGRHRTVYIRCTDDAVIPLAQQNSGARRCDHVVSLDADHSPFVSATAELADAITAEVVA